MNRPTLRAIELIIYALIAGGLLCLAGLMIYLNRTGEAFGTVIATIPVVIQAIGRISQAQAMATMADHLAQSSPIQKGEE